MSSATCLDVDHSALLDEEPPLDHEDEDATESEPDDRDDLFDADSLGSLGSRAIDVQFSTSGMGDILREKLQTVISLKFESYVDIVSTVHSELDGKLKYLDCQLLTSGPLKVGGISIACLDDNTFLVFLSNLPTTVLPLAAGTTVDRLKKSIGGPTGAPLQRGAAVREGAGGTTPASSSGRAEIFLGGHFCGT